VDTRAVSCDAHAAPRRRAPALRAVVEFLRDAPGSESLGIAYAGLYMTLDSLAVDKQTSTLAGLGPARAWVTPEWRGRTLALR